MRSYVYDTVVVAPVTRPVCLEAPEPKVIPTASATQSAVFSWSPISPIVRLLFPDLCSCHVCWLRIARIATCTHTVVYTWVSRLQFLLLTSTAVRVKAETSDRAGVNSGPRANSRLRAKNR